MMLTPFEVVADRPSAVVAETVTVFVRIELSHVVDLGMGGLRFTVCVQETPGTIELTVQLSGLGVGGLFSPTAE